MKKIIIVLLVLALFVFPVAALEESGLLSRGKTYTLVTTASAAYPDTESYKLTDGNRGVLTDGYYYKSDAYVGFNQANKDENGDFVIILDLGSDYTNIKSFNLSYLAETDVGIYAPQSYTVYVSDAADGTYSQVGSANITESTAAGVSVSNTSAITAAEDVAGRYVKFVIHHQEPFDDNGTEVTAGWTFIDEIEVYASTSVPQTGDDGIAVIAVIAVIFGSAWLGIKFRKHA